MTLIKKAKATNSDDRKRISELWDSISNIDSTISKLQEQKRVLQEEMLSIEIAPFKIGGYALAEVSSGRSKKEQKCLLECEDGILFLRPVKPDGELSGRHFSLIPIDGDYLKHLKEVK